MKKTIRLTDHAVLRYLERVKGIDVEGYRRSLEKTLDTPRMQRIFEFVGDTNCKVKTDDITYCIRDKRVITCYPG